jgi:hypothetical protein
MSDYHIADPVVDLAQGRPMVVVDAPDLTVAEWSDLNDYDLRGNYANGKFDPAPDEAVVECVYVSDVRSEPSKTYTFPVSRVALIDVHHADDGRRLYQRCAVAVLATVFTLAHEQGNGQGDEVEWLRETLPMAFGEDIVGEAWELADVEQTIGGEDV